MSHSLIVERDGTILVDMSASDSADIVKQIQRFSEHIKTIGHFECYVMSAISIWNALASGMSKHKLIPLLERYKAYNIPLVVQYQLQIWLERYDKLKLVRKGDHLCVLIGDVSTMQMLRQDKLIMELAIRSGMSELTFKLQHRGQLKQLLVHLNFNVMDECGFQNGTGLSFDLLKQHKFTGRSFELREYQRKAIASFHRDRIGGSGVIVLPCGTGKTLTGIGVMTSLQCETLIITSNTISCEQWKEEILTKTSLSDEQIGIYGGKLREVKSITIATYHILSYRDSNSLSCPHMKLFNERNWGLIIYDEVHLLPAPVFRMTASIQATRRLGLTATLIREDGCAPDVYALVGAKLFDLQWKEAEQRKVIAQVQCLQIEVPLQEQQVKEYNQLTKREQYKYASINETKYEALSVILNLHKESQILIIGQYIEQLEVISTMFNVPLITGQTSHEQRQVFFDLFRENKINVLALSKIANLALNLPNASVAIQVSGSYGSRQEEAQRVGRVIRPKEKMNRALFYSLVSKGTIEEQFSLNRVKFLAEQGYMYEVMSLEQLQKQGGTPYDHLIIQ